MDKVKQTIYLPEETKKQLEEMSGDVAISQNQLIVLATHSLIANWKEKGSFIFVDLLDPKHRQKR